MDGRFDMEYAEGPFRLDLGDVLYAPNVTRDDQVGGMCWSCDRIKNGECCLWPKSECLFGDRAIEGMVEGQGLSWVDESSL